MRLDLRALVVIAVALVAAATFTLVPTWVAVTAAIIACAATGQHIRASRASARAEEERLIAEHAPELVGLSFADAAAFMLRAADEFRATAPEELQQVYQSSLLSNIAAWKAAGNAPPAWAAFALMREFEAEWAKAQAGVSEDTV